MVGYGHGVCANAQSRADDKMLSLRRGRRTWSGRRSSRKYEGTTVEGCVVARVAVFYDIIGGSGGGRSPFEDEADERLSGVRPSQSRVVPGG